MGRAVLRSLLPFLVGLPILAVAQVLVPDGYFLRIVVISVNVVLAVSLNVVNGFTGQFSLGHAGFMAVGAYTAAKITHSRRRWMPRPTPACWTSWLPSSNQKAHRLWQN